MTETDNILARIDERLESIDDHLHLINGRLDSVERLATLNDKTIAVIVAEKAYHDDAQDKTNIRLASSQQRLDDKFYGFIKENGLQLGTLGTLVAVLGKQFGWW